MADYDHIAKTLMNYPPHKRLAILEHYRDELPSSEYAEFKSGVTAAARELREAGVQPVGGAPTRRLAPHEERSIQRSAQAIAKAHQAGHPAAQNMAALAAQTPRTSAPADPNSADYQAVLQQIGVRPETGRHRFRDGYYTGGRGQ